MSRNSTYLYFLIGGFLLLLLLPMSNNLLNYFTPAKLEGAFTLKEKPTITSESWFNYEFQPKYEAWLEENIGFRPTLIRIYNQFNYSIFNNSNASSVFIGKEDVLYQEGYFNTYIGSNYVGKEKVMKSVRKTSYIQEKLKSKNVPFLFVMAPGKVSIYPEYLPSIRQKEVPDTTNGHMYAKYFEQNAVNFIDFNEIFLQLKDTVSYPLFPKGGIHWSGSAVAFAADTIFRKLGALANINFPEIVVSKGRSTDNDFVFTDNDLEKLMNLLFPTDAWTLHYPKLEFRNVSKKKPRILIVGDSFAQSFFGFGPYYNSLFSNQSRYWQQYEFGYWAQDTSENYYQIEKSNLVETVESFDMVMVISTEINMHDLGMGFIDELYASYLNPTNIDYADAKTIGYFDFEDSDNIAETRLTGDIQDSTHGSYAHYLTKKKTFSRTFQLPQEVFHLVDNQIELVISVDYWIDSISDAFENEVKLVAELNSMEPAANLKFDTWGLTTPEIQPKQWNTKTVTYKTLAPSDNFAMKVYVYNVGETPILIDNFKVQEAKF